MSREIGNRTVTDDPDLQVIRHYLELACGPRVGWNADTSGELFAACESLSTKLARIPALVAVVDSLEKHVDQLEKRTLQALDMHIQVHSSLANIIQTIKDRVEELDEKIENPNWRERR